MAGRFAHETGLTYFNRGRLSERTPREAMPEKQTQKIGKGKAGPGRPKGIPNKVTSELKAAIMAAFDEAGGVDYLVKLSKDNPPAFCALLGKVLPLQVTGDDGGPLTVQVLKFADTAAK